MGIHTHTPIYGYVPTLWICILFLVLYSITTTLHIVQATRSRLWFLFPTACLAGIAEIIGWSGRLWSSRNPTLLDPFLMQQVTTILAPTPFIAANFVILGELIRRLGPQYSRLGAMWYTIVFVVCDIISLVVQSVGGATASIATENDRNPNSGGHIMLGGIVFQMVAIIVYFVLATEFTVRFLLDRPLSTRLGKVRYGDGRLKPEIKWMLFGLAFSSTTVFIRAVYRTIELSDGWTGRIITTQRYFNVLDGAMIILAFYTLNIFHPGRLLGSGPWRRELQTAEDLERKEITST